MSRRTFCASLAGTLVGAGLFPPWLHAGLMKAKPREDIFAFMSRMAGRFDLTVYRQFLGAANSFKEGDLILGVAAVDEPARSQARQLLVNTRARDIKAHPPFDDGLYRAEASEVTSMEGMPICPGLTAASSADHISDNW